MRGEEKERGEGMRGGRGREGRGGRRKKGRGRGWEGRGGEGRGGEGRGGEGRGGEGREREGGEFVYTMLMCLLSISVCINIFKDVDLNIKLARCIYFIHICLDNVSHMHMATASVVTTISINTCTCR